MIVGEEGIWDAEDGERVHVLVVNEKLVDYVFFFFQAEDGIRDYKVTGVQTCALPIYFAVKSKWPDYKKYFLQREKLYKYSVKLLSSCQVLDDQNALCDEIVAFRST